MKTNYIISAAGGNNTAIKIIEKPLSRIEYEEIGSKILKQTERKDVEQVGFLIPSIKHFEMSGGEFCGNAARSAAFLLSRIFKEQKFTFTMSGFSGNVNAVVGIDKDNIEKATVSCYFEGLVSDLVEKEINSKKVSVVDLGGIVHCILHEPFPHDSYKKEHSEIVSKLKLGDRSAVGVLWLNQVEDGLKMDPVVWVKSIDTFFYETSCGSGSIAAAISTGEKTILQPSGEKIEVEVESNGIRLTSRMEEIVSDDDLF